MVKQNKKNMWEFFFFPVENPVQIDQSFLMNTASKVLGLKGRTL